jgi:hypothetical protein
MAVFDIEKNVPLPIMYGDAKYLYPFMEMELNDSFFVPFSFFENGRKGVLRVRVSASYYGKKLGRKFSARFDGEGIRVWRIK